MAGLGDILARSQAAGSMMNEGPMSAPPGEESAELPEMPAEEDALEGALAQVEAATEGMDQAVAEKVRDHINAIRDLASKEPAPVEEELPVDELPPESAPPGPGGDEKLPV